MLPDYPNIYAGGELFWQSSAGDGALTLTSLADGAARQGAKLDLLDGTAGLPVYLTWRLESAVGSAAANGLQLELFFGESNDNIAANNNPGNLTGADGALSNPDELKYQLLYAGALTFSNARGTNVQKTWGRFYSSNQFLMPVLVNHTGQTLSGTAGNHVLAVTPYYCQISD